MDQLGRVASVNVGCAAPLGIGERTVRSGIVKRPIAGAVAVHRTGLTGALREPQRLAELAPARADMNPELVSWLYRAA